MLNGYAFKKRLEEFNKMDTDEQKQERLALKHKGEREILAQNYKHRVDKFIHDVSFNSVSPNR